MIERARSKTIKKNLGKRLPRRTTRPAKYKMPAGTKIDYKDINLLQKYLTDRGKIVSRRLSGVTAKQQREISIAIKRARTLALLPVGPGGRNR